jgi:polysaccharide export outer membrane protein
MKGKPSIERAVRGAIALLAISALVIASGVSAQTSQQQTAKPPATASEEVRVPSTIVLSSGTDYRISPRDVLEVRIEDAPELSLTYPVGADGTILMGYIGRVKAQDKTPDELSRLIADGLRGRYLKNPQVLVTVKQFYSQSYFIQGAVRSPGVYQVQGKLSLLRLITIAGGPAENHGSIAFIIREARPQQDRSPAPATSAANPVTDVGSNAAKATDTDQGEDDFTVMTVNINGLFKGRLDNNMIVEPGDIINIPPADVFFVAGEVHAPGSFTLKDGTTLRQAIALAQGTTANAATGRGVIFREDANGKRQEIKIDIGDVMKGRSEDLSIQANDLIMVPNSRGKTVGNTLLRALGMGTVQRGVYR